VPPGVQFSGTGSRRLAALALVAQVGLAALAGCTGSVAAPDQGQAGSTGLATGQGGTNTGTGGNTGTSGGNSTGGATSGKGGSSSSTGGSSQSACTSSESPGAPVPMRRLTATQVERSVADLFGVEAKLDVKDERLLMFRSNISTSVDVASARGYFDFAAAVVNGADLARCESACLPWLLDEVGLRLFRRPLSTDERDRYTELFELGVENDSERAAAEWVLEAMLQSPSFLYLDEVVDADGMLDDYSMAARLSLLIWGSGPDLALLERAADGELSSVLAIEEEVTRLLDDPRSRAGIQEFVDQWLDLARLDDPDTRPDLAELGAATVSALRDEPVAYFERLLREGAGLGELLTSTNTLASDELEEIYADDIVANTSDGFELDPERRGGILSLPGVVAALSHARRTSPTLRGKAVLSGLLCTPPEPPPANVDATLPEVEDDVTTRERLEQHQSSPACNGCHASMDGIGFALEKLDWLGRFREEENDIAIDDTSTFELGAGVVTVTGAAELGQTLSASPDVAQCLSRQWLRYSAGVMETDQEDCLVEELSTAASGADGLKQMIVKTLTSDWFRRGPGEAP
jgi:hypothetical protein